MLICGENTQSAGPLCADGAGRAGFTYRRIRRLWPTPPVKTSPAATISRPAIRNPRRRSFVSRARCSIFVSSALLDKSALDALFGNRPGRAREHARNKAPAGGGPCSSRRPARVVGDTLCESEGLPSTRDIDISQCVEPKAIPRLWSGLLQSLRHLRSDGDAASGCRPFQFRDNMDMQTDRLPEGEVN